MFSVKNYYHRVGNTEGKRPLLNTKNLFEIYNS